MAMVPRPASTVVVVREGPGGAGDAPEFLLLRRSIASRFAPGFAVFPGGTVEPADEEWARAWFGTTGEDAVTRACAVRELAEETGLVLTPGGLVEAPGQRIDISDLPPEVRDTMRFVPVTTLEEALAVALPRATATVQE